MLAVVIPYFQRTPGLLSRCVDSVLRQSAPWPISVLVADDGSPLPARDELDTKILGDNRVRVLCQANAGAGAARNLGLDQLPPETQFVGFLDSDDWWEPGFAEAAGCALRHCDVDLFFSDSQRYGQAQSRFVWEGDGKANLIATQHHCIDCSQDLYEYTGDFFDFMLSRSSAVGTSSMVYRLTCAPELRFDTSLYNGQDRLFKLKLSRRVRRAVFCARTLSMEGEGINIFDSARWGSPKGIRLAVSYVALGNKILASLPMSADQTRVVRAQVESARQDLVFGLAHAMAHGLPIDWNLARQAAIQDPGLLPQIPLIIGKAAWKKFRAGTS